MSTKWQEFNPIRPFNIPPGPGVYVLLVDGIAIYVGQSMRLRERIYSYKFRYGYACETITPWGDIEKGQTLTIKIKQSRRIGDWAMWEIRLIHRLKPINNRTHRKLVGAR